MEEALLPADAAFVRSAYNEGVRRRGTLAGGCCLCSGEFGHQGVGFACWICAYWFVRSAYNEGVHS